MKRISEVEVLPTPKEIARVISDMFDNEQIEMLNELGRIIKEEWEDSNMGLGVQLIKVIDGLDGNGKFVTNMMRDYVE
jgi:hypothetical protein